MRSVLRIASVAAAVALALTTAGCGSHRSPVGLDNQPPSVTLTQVSAGTGAHALRWIGTDPDGRVDHYVTTGDPRTIATRAPVAAWTRVDATSKLLGTHGARPAGDEDAVLRFEPTFFSVRAVDDDGEASDPATISFFGDNVAPVVQIVQPVPNVFYALSVPPTLRIRWQGNDPDGATPNHLAKYKYKLLRPGADFPLELALANPDSLRRYYAPAFSGWDSLPGDSLGVTLSGLTPGQEYLFVLVGFDESGDYSPVFSRNTNMLLLSAAYTEFMGPRMTVMGNGLYYQFRFGGVIDSALVTIPGAGREPVEVRWVGQPALGATIAGYRWAIDIADPTDQTPRLFPLDVRHWSRWSPKITSAMVSPLLPYPPKLSRRLYIEAMDSNGLKSRVVVAVQFLNVRRTRPTLVVLDLRVQPELGLGTSGPVTPVSGWPNSAELDSFLVARGGVPWVGYPEGATSSPGLFAGYDFDVLRTRELSALDRTVPLELLMRYRNVVWLIDSNVSLGDIALSRYGGPYSLVQMCQDGHQNTLVAYTQGGGRLWLAGGAAAYAMSKSRDLSIAGSPFGTFSAAAGDLVPGMAMWDMVRWRSEFRVDRPSSRLVTRIAPTFTRDGMPDYSALPASLNLRTAATDPLPPRRNAGSFYNVFPPTFEYLTLPNVITEGCGWGGRSASVLDSLYTVRGVAPGGVDLPCMTVYRGHDGGQVVFSGFDLWTWQRAQSRALVDGVLRDLWHLTPTTEANGTAVVDDTGGGTADEALVRR